MCWNQLLRWKARYTRVNAVLKNEGRHEPEGNMPGARVNTLTLYNGVDDSKQP